MIDNDFTLMIKEIIEDEISILKEVIKEEIEPLKDFGNPEKMFGKYETWDAMTHRKARLIFGNDKIDDMGFNRMYKKVKEAESELSEMEGI